MTRWAALTVALATACAPDGVTARVLHAQDDDPFDGADSLAVGLERDGEIIEGTATELARDAQWTLASLPFGEGLRIVVETRLGEAVLGRGRSFPFSFPEGVPPSASTDIHVGTLGLFGRTADGGTRAAAILATEDGATWVTEAGDAYHYVAHGVDGRASVAQVAAHHAVARWVTVPQRGFLGIDGVDAIVLAQDGSLLGRTSLTELADHGDGAAIVALDEGALVIGGGTALTRLDLTPANAVVATRLDPLPFAAPGARGIAVRLAGGTRVFALGALGDAFLIDPTGGVASTAATIAAATNGAAIGVLALGASAIVALAGGRSAAGVDGRVTTLLVTLPDDIQTLLAPEELAVPRTDARLVEVSTGLLLVVGGVDEVGTPIRRAELIELRGLDELPGNVRATGELPSDAPAPVGVALGDGSVLLVDRDLVGVYTDPRTPSGLP